jgi:hypothetical protein
MTTGKSDAGRGRGRSRCHGRAPAGLLPLLPTVLLSALVAFLLAGITGPAWGGDDDLENLLEEVTQRYAEGYLAPLVASLGANQNSGLYTTASIPRARLTFSAGLKVTATHLAEGDQNFRKVFTRRLDETVGVDPSSPLYGEQGVVVMQGPTVFGSSDTMGTIQAYYEGLPITPPLEGIEGLADTRWMPLVVPEVSVGGIAGLRATLRWFPSIKLGDLGKMNFFGYGLQYSVSNLVPTLPVDVMVGFFHQNLDLADVIEASASSYFLAVSKGTPILTVYAGAALESSELDISYTYRGRGETRKISFSMEPEQDSRLTLGATLNLGMKLNAEVGTGKVTTYTIGALIGF